MQDIAYARAVADLRMFRPILQIHALGKMFKPMLERSSRASVAAWWSVPTVEGFELGHLQISRCG